MVSGDYVTATVLNTKMTEIEIKIPDSSSWVTTAVLNTRISNVENIIPSISDLVKKTD